MGVEGHKPSDIDLSRSGMHRIPARTVVRLPNPSYCHATTGGRHQQLFYRFKRFVATSYHHAISASHNDQRWANHAARSCVGCLHPPMAEEEGADIHSTTGSDERELRLPLSVLLPAQRLAGSGELSFRLGLGRVDGEETPYCCRKRLRMFCQKSTSAPPSSDRSA
jgi:hypothetical protein